ncbi:MAG: hypothetical protein K2G47_05895 [Muribaculum sp.]|nr:hypothetical protein [Muribaculum sp.]
MVALRRYRFAQHYGYTRNFPDGKGLGGQEIGGGGVAMFRLPGWASSLISRGLSGAKPSEKVIENSLFPRGIIMDIVIEDSLRETIVVCAALRRYRFAQHYGYTRSFPDGKGLVVRKSLSSQELR